MRKLDVISTGVALLLLLLLASAGTRGQVHENPTLSDPALELARLRNEGVAQFESGIGLKKALAAFEAALKLQPRSGIELYNLGTTQRKLGNQEAAGELLARAVQTDPKLPHPAYALGLVKRARGDAAGAVVAFEAARTRAPAEPSVHYQLGRLYREQRQDPQALQSFIDTLQLDPQHTGAMYQLYLYHQEHAEADRAKAMFNEFSRVKRALTLTRKELNDDESVLARPLTTGAPAQPVERAATLRFSPTRIATATAVTSIEVRDMDGDGQEDLLLGAADGSVSLYRNQGQRRFGEPLRLQLTNTGAITQLRSEILVRGERPRVVAIAGGRVLVSKTDTTKTPLEFQRVGVAEPARSLAFADLDHDGDVDLAVDAFQEVLLNDGAGGFQAAPYLPAATMAKLSALRGPSLAFDALQRNAVDFVLFGANGERRLLVDQLGGRHALQDLSAQARAQPVLAALAADLDNDGGIDFMTAGSAGIDVDYHQQRYQFLAAKLATAELAALTLGDFDNDGWKDVLAWTAQGTGRWYRNLGDRKFSVQPSGPALAAPPLSGSIASDLDGDGRLDIAAALASGAVELLWNTSEGLGQATRIHLTGLRSAPSSLHTVVEVRRGSFYEKYVSDGRTLHLPLGANGYAEVLRISWPNGFVESKLRIDAGKRWAFAESERVSGSCPSVFAWDGAAFHFVTDAFISGPMGVPMAKDRYFPVDHDEYVKIPGRLLRAVDGRLRVAITEELREAVFLDRVRLIAVDHPVGTEMYPNEYLLAGDFPAFKLHLTRSPQAPRRALDHRGRDVTDLIREVDRRYPHGFQRLQYEGLAQLHSVEFDLPEPAARTAQLRLFLTGWFHYFESTSLVAAAQRNDLQILWPQVEAWLDGRWRKLTTIGIPSGKDKTVVVDLSGRVPHGVRRLRIRTNLALYWDRIALDLQPPQQQLQQHAMEVASAKLRFKGFSGFEVDSARAHARQPMAVLASGKAEQRRAGLPSAALAAPTMPQPERFVYGTQRFAAPWNPLVGRYTRYGGVGELLQQADSLMAVFGAGDELLLEFDAGSLAGPARGWERDYLLYLDGFVKDGDKYTAHAGTLEPTPYAGMREYPYSNAPATALIFGSARYRDYLARYQTRLPLRFTGPALAAAPFTPFAIDKENAL